MILNIHSEILFGNNFRIAILELIMVKLIAICFNKFFDMGVTEKKFVFLASTYLLFHPPHP